MSKFLPLAEAAQSFGFKTGPAMLKAFRRGLLPGGCLLRVGERGLRVDVDRLSEAIRQSPAYGPSKPLEGGQK